MRVILISFLIIVVISGFFFLGKFLTGGKAPEPSQLQGETPQEGALQEEAQKGKPSKGSVGLASVSPASGAWQPAVSQKPVIFIDTYITAGPEEGEIIADTNKVTFEFEAKIFPKETESRISFETKIMGFDKNWKKTYSKKRTINLPPGPKEYTFLVRAKIKDSTDPVPASRTFKINTSPYFGKVKISRPRAKTSRYPSLIKLRPRLGKEEKINITNWRLKGRKGEIIIPQAIEKYRSDVAPGNIIIGRSQTLYLLSGQNPLGRNRNFRLNKCFGYLQNYHKFYPSFSKSCPKPTLAEISHLKPYCQEYIRQLSRCEIPNYSNNLQIAIDFRCTSYLRDNFSYSACFKKHSRDEDFLKNLWYVYLGRDIVTKLHDTLYLYDQNGLIVDKYLY